MPDRGSTFLLVAILVLVVVLAVFAMKYFVDARTARLRLASEEAFRDLAARFAKSSEQGNAALSALFDSAADIQGRLDRIEKVLKEVE